MELAEVVRRRRMVRDFLPKEVPPDVLERVLAMGPRAPSAGFAQGLELVVLEAQDQLAQFWRMTDPRRRKHGRETGDPPVVVIPLSDKAAYLERYSQPDKRGLGMDVEQAWPMPYWDLDAAMSVMLMLLAAVDEGLGAWFFGIFRGQSELLEWLGAPAGLRPIGAMGLGYASPGERRRGSELSRARRPLDDVVRRGGWTTKES